MTHLVLCVFLRSLSPFLIPPAASKLNISRSKRTAVCWLPLTFCLLFPICFAVSMLSFEIWCVATVSLFFCCFSLLQQLIWQIRYVARHVNFNFTTKNGKGNCFQCTRMTAARTMMMMMLTTWCRELGKLYSDNLLQIENEKFPSHAWQ